MIQWIHQAAEWISRTTSWGIMFFVIWGGIAFLQIWFGNRAARRSK